MKKTSRIIIALVTVLVLGLTVAGCSCSTSKDTSNTTTANSSSNTSSNKTDTTTNNTSTTNNTAAPTSTDSNSVVGSWVNNDMGIPVTMTFNADGTGKYEIAGQVMNFTYKTEGNKLSITFEGDTQPMNSDMTVNGDTLSMKDITGQNVIFKKS